MNINEYLNSLPIYIMLPLSLLFFFFIMFGDFLFYIEEKEIGPYMPEFEKRLELEHEKQIFLEKLNEIKERNNNE